MDFCFHFASDLRIERSALHETRTALCKLFTTKDSIFICRALYRPDLHDMLFCNFVQCQKHSCPHGALLVIHPLKV